MVSAWHRLQSVRPIPTWCDLQWWIVGQFIQICNEPPPQPTPAPPYNRANSIGLMMMMANPFIRAICNNTIYVTVSVDVLSWCFAFHKKEHNFFTNFVQRYNKASCLWYSLKEHEISVELFHWMRIGLIIFFSIKRRIE